MKEWEDGIKRNILCISSSFSEGNNINQLKESAIKVTVKK